MLLTNNSPPLGYHVSIIRWVAVVAKIPSARAPRSFNRAMAMAAAAAAVPKVRGPTCRSRAQAEPAARLAQAPRASRPHLATAALNHTPKS